MYMVNNYIIAFFSLLIFNHNILGQTSNDFKIKIKSISNDTIDYIYLTAFKGYAFSKITEGKSNYLYKKGDGGLTRFCIKIDSSYRQMTSSNTLNLKLNDTIADVWWFLQKYDAPIYRQSNFGHTFGKLSINIKGNVLKIQDVRNNVDLKTNFGTLLFKVIKISPYEIILEDLQNREKHRRYYFKKNY